MIADRRPTPIGGAVRSCEDCGLEGRAFCAGLIPKGALGLRSMHGGAVDAGRTIFLEGEPAERVYTLTKGAAKLSKLMSDGRRQVVGFLFCGDFFGLSMDEAYGYAAETITPVRLCGFARKRLFDHMKTSPDLRRRLFERLVAELAFAQEQMLLLGRMSAREKVAHFILSLSRRAKNRGERASPVAAPMSRRDMADYLGLTVETVSRAVTALKREGVITLINPHMMEIAKMESLRALAGGEACG